MTDINEFYQKGCEKIDAKYVDAYLKLGIDPVDNSVLELDNSWGKTTVDLTDLVKSSETKTELKLYPEDDPTYLAYYGETGTPQCISGDDLSGIISMSKLKDVSVNTVEDGDTYIYDEDSTSFITYNLKNFTNSTETRLSALEGGQGTSTATIAALQSMVEGLQTSLQVALQKINALETLLTKPAGVPNDATVAWGNVNYYSDYTNANLRTSGIYTHDVSTTKANDQRMA